MPECPFHAELWLPRPRPEVFGFFSDAHNLELLTPPWLRFDVLTPRPISMRTGALIDYQIRVRGFPAKWQTEILQWSPPERFVDQQLRGPYKLWHHTHTFREEKGGTLCIDDVRYWPRGGALINWLFVRRDLDRIFAFRQKRLKELLGPVE
jgi:ligand-binding SRPBCC domain-containing protein